MTATRRRAIVALSYLVLGFLAGALTVVLVAPDTDCRCNPAERELGLARCN